MKATFRLEVRRMPLSKLEQWVCDGESIRHVEGRFFVSSASR